jgi:hypothetical protein
MGAEIGRAAVVGEAMAAAASDLDAAKAAAGGEQMPLFDIPTRFLGVRADGAPDDRVEKVERAAALHRRGRPPGAVNRSTAELRKWLLGRGVHPLEQLMRWAMHTPESLAAELGCTLLEAFREWKSLQVELAPYFAAKVVPVDDNGNAVPFFQMIMGGAGSGAGPGAAPPWLAQDEQNQRVIEAAPEVSHGMVSHGPTK